MCIEKQLKRANEEKLVLSQIDDIFNQVTKEFNL